MENIHYVSPERLTIDRVGEILEKNMHLALSDESVRLITRCREYLDNKIESSNEPVYGITTGFGCGDPVSPEIVRIMLLTKIMSLSFGNSGVQLSTVQRLIDMFNNDVLPVVYSQGSLGASGDLAPLANMSLPLIGLGKVIWHDEVRDSWEVLKELGWEPVHLVSKEGLALLNGTQFMSSHRAGR